MKEQKAISGINLIKVGITVVLFVFLIIPNSARAEVFVLIFNGAASYVDCGYSESLDISDAITLEAWIFANNLVGEQFILSREAEQLYALEVFHSNKFVFELNIDGENIYLDSVTTAQTNQWYHVMATYDKDAGENNKKIYINGVLDAQETQTGQIGTNVENLLIGAYETLGAANWNGYIDEVRIYNRALSAEEVAQHYAGSFVNETGLVGLWHMHEGSGDFIFDSSGQGNNGNIYGAAWVPKTISPVVPPGVGVINNTPTVKFETKLLEKYRSILSFNYSVYDPDSGQAALLNQPMKFYYCNEEGAECQAFAQNEANTGSYNFDTAKIPDGNYKIRVVAFDGYDFGDAFSDAFSTDNTVPTFDISISPSPPVREIDEIELKISASEELKAKPELNITQEGGKPIRVEVTGSGKEFSASYLPQRGYPGKAVISISGEDLIGNIGGIIASGKSFSIERYGPPAPTIKEPLNNQVFTQPLINFSGVGQPNVKINLVLNGVTQFSTQTSNDGTFNIPGITLSLTTANKGYNTLSVVGINEKGEESEEVVLRVKLNSPPKIKITSSFDKIIVGEKQIDWTASDLNDDPLVFSIEYSNDGGISWDSIISDLSETSYKIDTTQLGDGPDYFLRVTADDGTQKTSALSPGFTIKNNLPHISLNIPSNYFTNTSTPEIKGMVTSPENVVVSVKYSLDQGKIWQETNPLDGNFNSLKEEFEIPIIDPLPDNQYSLLIKAEDIMGHSVKTYRIFTVDTLPPPTPTVEVPNLEKPVDDSMDTNQQLEGIQIVLQGKTEAKNKIEFILEDEKFLSTTNQDGEFSIKDVTLKTHGSNKFSLSAFDLAGNSSRIEGVLILNNPPQLSVSDLKEGDFLGGTKEIAWQADDLDNDPLVSEILYQKKNGNWISGVKGLAILPKSPNVYKWNISKIANGDYKIKIIVSDGLNETEAVVSVFIDNIYPKGMFNIVGPSVTNNTRPNFSGQASDDFSGIQYVEYSFNDVDWYKAVIGKGYQELKADFEFQHSFPLSDGDYNVKTRITDRAGNVTYLEPKSLTIDTTPPRIGSNLISAGALILFPDENGVIKLLKGANYKILVSVAGEAKEVGLKSKDIVFNLNFNKATLLWESEFNFGTAGDYPLEINAVDGAGNSQTREIANLKVLPQGYVYNEKDNQPIAKAKITLYIFDQTANSWLVWDGAAFNQKNPWQTETGGEYGFLVPPGKYKLKISSRDFESVSSKELEIKNNSLISVSIPLTEKKGVFNKILNYFEDITGGSQK